ncbi:MAG: hypothetical protein MUF49_31650 [Oculatellaceae cyanobacterium Prado106]|nr:hypothetical protein [Oculatellaceae cyanobacterium Prado106]
MSQSIQAPIATWFRACLAIAALFNLCGALSFAPPLYNLVAPSLGLSNWLRCWVIAPPPPTLGEPSFHRVFHGFS